MAVSFKNFNNLFPPPIKNKITQIKLNKNSSKDKIPHPIKTAIKLNIKN